MKMVCNIMKIWERDAWLRKSLRYRDYFFTRQINRIKTKKHLVGSTGTIEDITVVLAVRNRCDYRLVNAFKSMRNQDYDDRLIKIVLVDYDSEKWMIEKYQEICQKYRVEYIRVDNKPVWNKSRCLNIAIKNVASKYICSSDVDVFFEKNYFSECVKELNKNPLQVLISDFYNSPEGEINGEIDLPGKYADIKNKCGFQNTKMGLSGFLNPGINFSLSCFYKAMNGYDENYIMWGSEDFDLIKRFFLMGLEVKDMSPTTSWIHQWHKKHEGVSTVPDIKEQITKNKNYLNNTHSIVRNNNGWGMV